MWNAQHKKLKQARKIGTRLQGNVIFFRLSLLLPLSLMFLRLFDVLFWIFSLPSPVFSASLILTSFSSRHTYRRCLRVKVVSPCLCCHFSGITATAYAENKRSQVAKLKLKRNTQKPTRKICIAILCAQIIYLQPSVGVAAVVFSFRLLLALLLGCFLKFSQQVLRMPQNLQTKKQRDSETERKEKTQIRHCYHHSLILTPALCVRVLYLALRWIHFFFLSSSFAHCVPIAFISNNKMLNKQAACAHEMHRQMIPLLRTFSFAPLLVLVAPLTLPLSLSLSLCLFPSLAAHISLKSFFSRDYPFPTALQYTRCDGHFAWCSYSSLQNWFCVSQIDAWRNNFLLPLIFRNYL